MDSVNLNVIFNVWIALLLYDTIFKDIPTTLYRALTKRRDSEGLRELLKNKPDK